jgi:excisionase family DNA binding protein
MGLFRKSRKKGFKTNPAKENLPEKFESLEPSVDYYPDTLKLGLYWSENKQEYQIARIAEADRSTHFYVIGATGTGKTKFLEYLIMQDIEKRNGFGVIDPHGDLIDDIEGYLIFRYGQNEAAISDRVILIDPTDPNFTVTFNPLERIPGVSAAEQANELINAFKKIWSDSWGVRMEDLMRNSLIALAEEKLTLTELPQFLTHRTFRQSILAKVSHPLVREYFERFDNLTDRGQVTWIEPVTNKINAFFSDERVRQMFSFERSSFNLREIMDQQKFLLIKLDKGKLKESADLLGSLLMAKIQMAAFSRSDIPQEKRIPFYLYIDEFQNFASESFAVILSEARKYGLSLIMAHQTLAQIPEELRNLILANTGIQVYFRLNRHDASLLAKEAFEYSGNEIKRVEGFRPSYWSLGEEWELYTSALQSLPPRTCYIKHKIEGGIIAVETVELEPMPVLVEEKYNQDYSNLLKNYPLGRKYLVARKELGVLLEQRQKLIKEQIETRPILKPVTEPPKEAIGGKELSEAPAIKTLKRLPSRSSPELSKDEVVFLSYISEYPGRFVTQIYKDLGLSGYKGDKLKENLIEKGLVVQEDTRKGLRGRLAKVLILTEKGYSILSKLSPGKGGEAHKHLQMMLKEQAEVFGFKATIEEKIPHSLESVDVGLRKDDMRIALEISTTSKADQEIQNIRKCLDAGYDYVISVCDDEKSLEAIKKEVRKAFSFKEKERIKIYSPEEVKDFLSKVNSTSIVSEKGIVSGQISKEKQLLDTKEAAEYLGISRNTLYEWVIQNKIPYIKVGRLVKFRKEDLEAWLKRRTQEEKKDFV